NREIAETLHRLRQTGAEVSYFSADVRDPDAITPVFKAIRSAHGAVTALIHGAGVLEDRLIIDKTDAQLDRVIDTKVAGFLNLLDAVRPDSLKHLVLFTSVAARLGNMGQADYAMANEALNKIARREAAARPDCRVAAINWGPWDGGMVTDSLKREFQREGLGLIPLDAGGACMLQEMILPGDHPVEVVISAKSRSAEARDAAPPRLSAAAAASPAPVEKENLPLALKRNVGVEEYPILASHVIGGKPVVPFALMTEWFGHGALHGNPGLVLQGFDDMRVLKGIRLEEETKVVRLMAGKARKNGSMFEVNLELRDGLKENKEVIHSRARAILANALTDPPAPDPAAAAGIIASEPYHRTIQEVYQDILFHGVELHGVKDIIGLTDQGMAARLAAAPSPGQWVKTPLRSNWIGDPLVLDAAFQMATIWCFEKMGMVSLPSYLAAYRQHRERFPTEGVTAVLTVKEATSHKMRGDFIFLDAEDLVVARLTGYEAVMDETLFKSFKPEADAMERKSA
ncbi:MAG: SDR family oxidoreductase, partial [Desulfobacterales bacterium]|nr:SDR family oxidoreductase [Desulfobacterales bacterium]